MRKNYIKVEEISLSRLSHAEFINFMQRLRALLPIVKDEESRDAAPALAITADQVAELDGYLQTMNDLTRESQVKAETKPKKEIDRLRDSLISYIIEQVSRSRSLPLEEESKAAEQLYIVVKPYYGVGKLPYNQETEVIKGFLMDMNKTENTAAVTTLGLEKYLDQLQSYNNQFEALVKEADVKKASTYFSEKMRDVRVQASELYTEMADFAFASNLLNESEESLYFMAGLNALISSVKTAYNQRGSNTAKEDQPAADETPGGSTSGDGSGDSGLEFVPVEKN